jgi:RimJ/RimL family protein N-acetyltransferase
MYAIEGAPGDPLYTARLRLRPPRRSDLDPLHEAIAESLDELVRWLPWARPGHSRLDTRRYLRGARDAWSRRSAFEFVVEELEGGALVGITSLHRVDWSRRCAGLGYWMRRSRWGRGYATEAARATARHGFERLGLHRLELLVGERNHGSLAVVRKLGARREGLARDAEWVDGGFLDHVQFSLLESDWSGWSERR